MLNSYLNNYAHEILLKCNFCCWV